MLAVIFVRVNSRHNGGETGHRTMIRRDKEDNGRGSDKKPLRYNPCGINRKKRAKPAGGK
jgi:hypothetical protein